MFSRYYYRFNETGESQRTGEWSVEEKELFLNRLAEVGPEKWGIFSMTIPGRVGYQCSNYYRQLVASGEIKDSNYAFGADGKLHFIAKKSAGVKKPKVTRSSGEKDKKFTMTLKNASVRLHDNPLPDLIDPITLEPVERPAISPYGHVMGYDSWLKCLIGDVPCKNKCPLTKKPLSKRDLVILTNENIESYRSKIVNYP